MNSLTLPSSKDIYIEIDGIKTAIVESYKVTAERKNRRIWEIGSPSPLITLKGKTEYTVELSRLSPLIAEPIDVFSLSGFDIAIIKSDKKTVFSGCEWEYINESAKLSGSVVEKMRFTAHERVCTKNG